ncbi:hypothetical protein GF391_03825|nr:hypothetical protein [Candidatus Uhrbacteria bacterium]
MGNKGLVAAIIGSVVLLNAGMLSAAYFSPPGPEPGRVCVLDAETIAYTETTGARNHYAPKRHTYKPGDMAKSIFSTFDGLRMDEDGGWIAQFSNEYSGKTNSFPVTYCDLKNR